MGQPQRRALFVIFVVLRSNQSTIRPTERENVGRRSARSMHVEGEAGCAIR